MSQEKDNVSILLENLGRASTPPVKESPFGITLGSLIGLGTAPLSSTHTLVIGSKSFLEFAHQQGFTLTLAVPGIAPEQAADPSITAMVIDVDAFNEGSWLGADDGTSKLLAEQIFEAGRVLRSKGKNVFWIPSSRYTRGCYYARIKSTSTIDITHIPEVDLEEQAPQSPLWNLLQTYVEKRDK